MPDQSTNPATRTNPATPTSQLRHRSATPTKPTSYTKPGGAQPANQPPTRGPLIIRKTPNHLHWTPDSVRSPIQIVRTGTRHSPGCLARQPHQRGHIRRASTRPRGHPPADLTNKSVPHEVRVLVQRTGLLAHCGNLIQHHARRPTPDVQQHAVQFGDRRADVVLHSRQVIGRLAPFRTSRQVMAGLTPFHPHAR
jgi:hypothetical protein